MWRQLGYSRGECSTYNGPPSSRLLTRPPPSSVVGEGPARNFKLRRGGALSRSVANFFRTIFLYGGGSILGILAGHALSWNLGGPTKKNGEEWTYSASTKYPPGGIQEPRSLSPSCRSAIPREEFNYLNTSSSEAERHWGGGCNIGRGGGAIKHSHGAAIC